LAVRARAKLVMRTVQLATNTSASIRAPFREPGGVQLGGRAERGSTSVHAPRTLPDIPSAGRMIVAVHGGGVTARFGQSGIL
jgi:hypothetical protein